MSDPRKDLALSTPDDAAATALDVALSTSYDPMLLNELPQPVPKDRAPHMEPDVFHFQDAFDDLLLAAQGRPLMDITERYQQSKLLRIVYPYGESNFKWLQRLEYQGVIPARPNILSPGPGLGQLPAALRTFGGELNGVVSKSLGEAMALYNRATGDNNDGSRESVSRRASGEPDGKKEPDHFDDLFSELKSTFAESQGAWEAFKKTLNDDSSRRVGQFGDQKENEPRNQELSKSSERQINKNEKETTSEYVDRWGYRHTKVTRTQYDDSGNQTGSSTSITIAPDAGQDISNTSNPNSKSKGGGWFW